MVVAVFLFGYTKKKFAHKLKPGKKCHTFSLAYLQTFTRFCRFDSETLHYLQHEVVRLEACSATRIQNGWIFYHRRFFHRHPTVSLYLFNCKTTCWVQHKHFSNEGFAFCKEKELVHLSHFRSRDSLRKIVCFI